MIATTMTVAEVLERHPQTIDAFKKRGFGALANPFLRRTFAHLVTVGQACARHQVPVEEFLTELNAAAAKPGEPAKSVPSESTAVSDGCACGHHGPPPGAGDVPGPVRSDMNIGEAVGRFPETREVFSRFFGDGCFTCPSFGHEDIRFACEMHGTPLADFLDGCNRAVSAARDPDPASLTINELIRRHPGAARILNAHGLDSCCGGAKRLDEAAAKHGVKLGPVLEELRSEMAVPRT